MDYEKLYKEAFERAKKVHDEHRAQPFDVMLKVFPELKESENERIRKELINYFIKGKEYLNLCSFSKEEIVAWLEKQGEQKPTDKVEPKFKDGQWIVLQNKCYKVNYNGCGYELVDQNGLSTSLEYGTVDESAHLWNIEDAKDGDVLVASDGSIFIYKNQRDNGVVHYVAVTSYNDLVINENDYSWERKDVCHPATKDEQTILFERIKEAGYEWNAETKELKKIEQTTEIPFGAKDSEIQEATYHIPKGFHAEVERNKVIIKRGEHKPTEWSEDDDNCLSTIIAEFSKCAGKSVSKDEWMCCNDFLNSIRDRVQPL